MLLTELKMKYPWIKLKNAQFLCNYGSYRQNEVKCCRRYLQRRPPRILALSRESLLFTGNADDTIRDLLVMIQAHLWPRPELSFPYPNPHCHSNQEATEEHLLQHRGLGLDDAFHDPLIATLAGLIDWRMDMSNVKKFACHFMRIGTVTEQKILRSSRTSYWGTQRLWDFSRKPWVYRLVDKYKSQPHALRYRICLSRKFISRVWTLRKFK
jgi:hypothetical protein